MDFGKCSKSAKEHCSCCPLFSSLCFSSLHCSFLAYFERLWKRAMELQSFVLHEFELPKALLWTIYSSPSFLDCFGDQKAIKTPKLNTIWLELIARVLNMLIGLKGNKYYSKVFERVNYKLSNSTFWVVITNLSHELRAFDAIINLRLLFKWTTLGLELRALDAMNNLELWLRGTNLGHELRALDAMNSSRLWMTWAILHH